MVFIVQLGACKPRETPEDTLMVNWVADIAPANGDARVVIEAADKRINANDPMANSKYKLSRDLAKYAADKLDEKGYKINFVDWSWDAALVQKQTNALMSSGGGDAEVFIGDPMWMKNYVYMNGMLPFPKDLQSHIKDTMLPSAYSSMTVDGEIYGVNIYTTPMVLFVNMNIADMVFGEGNFVPPKTWQDFLDLSAAVELYARNNSKPFMPGAILVQAANGGYLRNNVFFRQQGFDFESSEAPQFNNANVKETLKFLTEVCKLNSGKVTYTDLNNLLTKFVNGESMFYMESSIHCKTSHLAATSKIPNVNYYPIPVPHVVPSDPQYNPDDFYGTSDAEGTMICTLALGVPNYVRESKREAAFEYIRAMIDETPQRAIRDEKSLCALNKAVVDDAEFIAKPENAYAVMFANFLRSPNMQSVPTFKYQNSKAWSQIGNAITRSTNPSVLNTIGSGDYDTFMSDSQNQLYRYWQQG